uniref:BTB domain-containing protein n=1 Tax=Panagrellus redivivus TaxID=6233 RepID=A0A7E4VTH0_PANRE
MSTINIPNVVYDTQTVIIDRVAFYQKKVNESIKTPVYETPQSGGLRWWVELYPAGFRESDAGNVSVFLHVNKPGKAEFTCLVDDNIQRSAYYECVATSLAFGWYDFASRDRVASKFSLRGNFGIAFSINFESSSLLASLKPSLFESCGHVDADFELVMEVGRVPVHKHLLSLMSPVFHAMFTHDTVEAKSGEVKITDIEYETVKASIDFCYGRGLKDASIDTVIGILRFADKYDIKAVTNQLESFPRQNLSIENYSSILHYAYDCAKQALLTECCTFFKNNWEKLRSIEKFTHLPIPVAVHLFKSTFDMESTLDVLCFAHFNGFEFIVEPLEQPLLQTVTIDNFCPTANYAWQCSREDLKNACATFFNDNVVDITKLQAFYGLPSKTIKRVMKLAYDLQNGGK